MIWTERARRMLGGICDYIAEHDSAAAERTVRGILSKADMLAELPCLGQECRIEGFEDLRILIHGHYKIIYSVGTNEQVTIIALFHGRMDIERHLKGGT